MTFAEFEKLLHGPDMLRIIQGDKEIYTGYFGTMQYDKSSKAKSIRDEEVIGFRAIPEIRHRQWRERGLDAPLLPEQLPQYSFFGPDDDTLLHDIPKNGNGGRII